MNKIAIIGNLTKEPEAKKSSSGLSICNLSVAVNRRFSNANGEKETDFFNVTVWRAMADNCIKYLHKGNKVAIIGTLQNRTYEVNGEKRYAIDIIAEEVEFLSSVNTKTTTDRPTLTELQPVPTSEELPF